ATGAAPSTTSGSATAAPPARTGPLPPPAPTRRPEPWKKIASAGDGATCGSGAGRRCWQSPGCCSACPLQILLIATNRTNALFGGKEAAPCTVLADRGLP